ncbi:TPA: transposase, partial [Serratia marcescens]|nr:transposase [Serratia marcescens]
MASLRNWVTAKEIAGLPGFPSAISSVLRRAKKENWTSRQKSGVKGVAYEFQLDCLPNELQLALRERHYNDLIQTRAEVPALLASSKLNSRIKPRQELELMRQCPALIEREVCGLTDDQKAIADARALLASEVERLRNAGLSRLSAVNYIVGGSRDGSLPENLMAAADLANARKGSRVGISRSSLQEWVSIFQATQPGLERLAMLAPGQNKRKKPEDASWFYGMFWPHYANRNGPSVREAYRSFRREWHEVYHAEPAMRKAIPSYYAVLRRVNQLPLCSRVQGRVSGSAKKAY